MTRGRSRLSGLGGYHSPQVPAEVRLNTNESPYPPPAAWQEDLAAAVAELEFHRYPDREAVALRQGIASLHGVAPEEVFCANGSNEVLQAICLAYGGAGRSAAVFEPSYALHPHIARLTGMTVIEGARDEELLVDESELARGLTAGGRFGTADPAIEFLCSPNNPTGRAEPRDTVERVVASAPGLVVVDEAYGQFARWSASELLPDNPHLVVVRTFSKTWSLAGLRLGYALGAPEVVEAMERVVLPYHLDAAKQLAGRLALRHVDEMHERVARISAERERVVHALRALGLRPFPSDANFVLFEVTGHDAREVWRSLVRQSVLVRDVSGFPRLARCLRVTIGTAAEDDAFLAALGVALS